MKKALFLALTCLALSSACGGAEGARPHRLVTIAVENDGGYLMIQLQNSRECTYGLTANVTPPGDYTYKWATGPKRGQEVLRQSGSQNTFTLHLNGSDPHTIQTVSLTVTVVSADGSSQGVFEKEYTCP